MTAKAIREALVRLLCTLYGWLIRCYPPGFRAAFGDEMRAVFADAASDAGSRGLGPLAVVWFRELRDWPGAVGAAYQAWLFRMGSQFGSTVLGPKLGYFAVKEELGMSDRQNLKALFSLLIGWVLANLIGWAAGLGASELLAPQVGSILSLLQYDSDMAFAYAGLIFLGLTVGVMQWMVLKRYLALSSRWIAVTMIGYLLCVVIFAFANSDPHRLLTTKIWNNVCLFVLMGTAIGASQWWVLRRHYANVWLWIVVSAIGFLFLLWGVVDPSRSQGEFIVKSVISGSLATALPGGMLVWMWRQSLLNALEHPA